MISRTALASVKPKKATQKPAPKVKLPALRKKNTSIEDVVKELKTKERRPHALVRWYKALRSPLKIAIATAIIAAALASTTAQGRQNLYELGHQTSDTAAAGVRAVKERLKVGEKALNATVQLSSGFQSATKAAGVKSAQIRHVVKKEIPAMVMDAYDSLSKRMKQWAPSSSKTADELSEQLQLNAATVIKEWPQYATGKRDTLHRNTTNYQLMKSKSYTSVNNLLKNWVPFLEKVHWSRPYSKKETSPSLHRNLEKTVYTPIEEKFGNRLREHMSINPAYAGWKA